MGSKTLIMSGERSLFPGAQGTGTTRGGSLALCVCVRFRVLKAAELYPKHCSIPGIYTKWKARGLAGCFPGCATVQEVTGHCSLSLCTKCLRSPLGRRVKLNPPSLYPQEMAHTEMKKLSLLGPEELELVNLALFACFSALSAQILSSSS